MFIERSTVSGNRNIGIFYLKHVPARSGKKLAKYKLKVV